MDWGPIKEGLRSWFAAQSKIDPGHVWWVGEAAGMGDDVEAHLSIVSTVGFGFDELVRSPTGQGGVQNIITSRGHRAITVQFVVEARHGTVGEQAITYATRVRDRIRLPSSDGQLGDAGLGLNSVVQCQPLPGRVYADRELTRAVLEVKFNALAVAVDEQLEDTVATVGISGTADGIQKPEQFHNVE